MGCASCLAESKCSVMLSVQIHRQDGDWGPVGTFVDHGVYKYSPSMYPELTDSISAIWNWESAWGGAPGDAECAYPWNRMIPRVVLRCHAGVRGVDHMLRPGQRETGQPVVRHVTNPCAFTAPWRFWSERALSPRRPPWPAIPLSSTHTSPPLSPQPRPPSHMCEHPAYRTALCLP